MAKIDYSDPAIDWAAEQYKEEIRQIVGAEGEGENRKVYVNFAVGDERLVDAYGSVETVARLKDVNGGLGSRECVSRSVFVGIDDLRVAVVYGKPAWAGKVSKLFIVAS